MDYINRFQNAHDLSVQWETVSIHAYFIVKLSPMWKIYYTDIKPTGRANKIPENHWQKALSVTSLHNDYLNIDISSDSYRNNERANTVHIKLASRGGGIHFAEKCFRRIINDDRKYCAAGYLDRQQTEHNACKYFICGSVDHLIAKCLKPPKLDKKRQKQVRSNEKGNLSLKN